MKKSLRKYMPFFAPASALGFIMSSCPLLTIVSATIFVFVILRVFVRTSYNFPIYQKAVAVWAGVMTGWLLANELAGMDIIGVLVSTENCRWLLLAYLLACAIIHYTYSAYLVYGQKQKENLKEKASWEERNNFEVRKYDLRRLKGMVLDPEIFTIGLEAEWGQGKSFLVEGLLEELEKENSKAGAVKIDVIIVDVLAIRMDKFPEYIVGELNNVLYKNGFISSNMKKLSALFKNARLDMLSMIWGDAEERYNKIFDNFRKELLSLGRTVLIIYEDLDRLEDKKAICDILYLSEKLTAANDRAKKGGIKVLYQYDRQHMGDLGLSVRFMEKYVRRHMDLSLVDFRIMVKKFQDKFKKQAKWKDIPDSVWLKEDEIMEFSFIKSEVNSWFPEEKAWIDSYLSQGLTVRRTVDFLSAVMEKLRNDKLNTEENRKRILAFYFIQYFLPEAYGRLKEMQSLRCSLWQVFRVPENEVDDWYFVEAARRVREHRLANKNVVSPTDKEKLQSYMVEFMKKIHYLRQPKAFELFVAFRLIFDDSNLPAEADGGWKNVPRLDFGAADSEEVSRRESLDYVDTEKMFRYLLEAGYEASNRYVHWANAIVNDVLSCTDRGRWLELFDGVLAGMRDDERGNGTLLRMGTPLWVDVFRAFVFAGKTWSRWENTVNFVRLIDLYEMDRERMMEANEPGGFLQSFIDDTLPLWEGLQGGKALCRFAGLVIRQQVVCNWSEYANFYAYLQAALLAMATNTYLGRYDLWSLEQMKEAGRHAEWEEAIEMAKEELGKASRELQGSYDILSRHKGKGFLPGELDHFKVLIGLVGYFKEVMDLSEKGEIRIGPSIRTEEHDPVAEAYDKADAIEDEAEFRKVINDPENGIGLANCVKLIKKHAGTWQEE